MNGVAKILCNSPLTMIFMNLYLEIIMTIEYQHSEAGAISTHPESFGTANLGRATPRQILIL